MPTYRVRDGEILAHDGKTREAGEILELPRQVADDPAVRGAIDEVDAAGHVVAPPQADDLARFLTHERVSMLRDRLGEAQARVEQLQAQLDAADQQLADEVKAADEARAAAAAPAKRATTKDAPAAAAPATPAS